jgi:hypothetical protein
MWNSTHRPPTRSPGRGRISQVNFTPPGRTALAIPISGRGRRIRRFLALRGGFSLGPFRHVLYRVLLLPSVSCRIDSRDPLDSPSVRPEPVEGRADGLCARRELARSSIRCDSKCRSPFDALRANGILNRAPAVSGAHPDRLSKNSFFIDKNHGVSRHEKSFKQLKTASVSGYALPHARGFFRSG